jgi:hypothetical protein
MTAEKYNGPVSHYKADIPEVVVVQEKLDGSQFSFGKTKDGELFAMSRNVKFNLDHPVDGNFAAAVAHVKEIADRIPNATTFRCEVLKSIKHNVLTYKRAPINNIALFDVELVEEGELIYADPRVIPDWACILDIEPIQLLFEGPSAELNVNELMAKESQLGGAMEGIVVKCDREIKVSTRPSIKIVSDRFKEVKHGGMKNGATPTERLQALTESIRSEARWEKAIAHLRDDGKLTSSFKDIGPLIGEITADIRKEEEHMIKEELFKIFWPQMARKATDGFGEFYKQRLGV